MFVFISFLPIALVLSVSLSVCLSQSGYYFITETIYISGNVH